MSWTGALVWALGLSAIISGLMWADQKTRIPFPAIFVVGIVASAILGQIVYHL